MSSQALKVTVQQSVRMASQVSILQIPLLLKYKIKCKNYNDSNLGSRAAKSTRRRICLESRGEISVLDSLEISTVNHPTPFPSDLVSSQSPPHQVGYQYQGGQGGQQPQASEQQWKDQRQGQFTQGLGWEHLHSSKGHSS